MSAPAGGPPGSPDELLDLGAAARLIGCCKRMVANDYQRLGVIRPPDAWGRFRREDVEACRAWFDARRREAADEQEGD